MWLRGIYIYDSVKDFEMKSFLDYVGPKYNHQCHFRREAKGDLTSKGEEDVILAAEI